MTEYLKGKDIKVQGDCLVHCYTMKIVLSSKSIKMFNGPKPEEFEKW